MVGVDQPLARLGLLPRFRRLTPASGDLFEQLRELIGAGGASGGGGAAGLGDIEPYRVLAQANPAVYIPNLAMSLINT